VRDFSYRRIFARVASKIKQHLERISAVAKPRQRAVMKVIEAMLAQQGR
jgi:hypothetical protein